MPVSVETTLATFVAQFAEVSFGTVSPSFDKIDAYIDPSSMGLTRTVWKLYVTTSGIKSVVAEAGPFSASDGPQRIVAGLDPVSASTYELVGSAVDQPLGPTSMVAALVGYDLKVNDAPPETSSSLASLSFGVETLFGTLANYHTNFQAEIDVTAAGPRSASDWTLIAVLTGAGGTIRVPVAQGQYAPPTQASSATQKTIVFRTSSVGASSYELLGRGTDPSLTAPSALVQGLIIGFSENLDNAGGGGGPPTGPAGGGLTGFYPNPSILNKPVLVFQPGGAPSDNVFTSWLALRTAFGITSGDVLVDYDDTFGSPLVPAGVYDWQGRASHTALVAKETPVPTQVTLADGAIFKDPKSFEQLLQVNVAATILPAMQFTAGRVVTARYGAVIRNTGPQPLVRNLGGLFVMLMSENSTYDNSPANGALVDMPNPGATSVLYSITGAGYTTDNVVTGDAASPAIFQFDASLGAIPTNPGYAGVATLSYLDEAEFVSYVDTPPLLGSNNVQGAIDALKNRSIPANTAAMVGGSGTAGYLSAPGAVSPTDANNLVTSRFAGAFLGVVGRVNEDGLATMQFTTAGGAPNIGAPIFLAQATDDGGTAAGKLTATAPSAVGSAVAEIGLCWDATNYAGAKTCVVLLQVKSPAQN